MSNVIGIIGGKFLERGRVKKPNQEMFSTKLSEYYSALDLFVGATVEFNNFKFQLIHSIISFLLFPTIYNTAKFHFFLKSKTGKITHEERVKMCADIGKDEHSARIISV